MSEELHTVLGASGGAGRAVVSELQKRNFRIRIVERQKRFPELETIQADLLDKEETQKAIEGSNYVYLCTGLTYSHKVWSVSWPLLMENVINACYQTGAVLIFLDNIYMYGPSPLSVPFDENHSQKPPSKKGIVRKQVADMLLKEIDEGKINAVIARAADFFGPNANNSLLYISFLERMLKGKSPQTIAKLDKKHTYANTTDIGRAMIELALDSSTYGKVWHLPVCEPATINEIMEMFNAQLRANYKASYLPSLMRKTLSVIIPGLKEAEEMLYQSNHDYVMSFEKFKNHFPEFQVSTLEEGIREMIESFKK